MGKLSDISVMNGDFTASILSTWESDEERGVGVEYEPEYRLGAILSELLIRSGSVKNLMPRKFDAVLQRECTDMVDKFIARGVFRGKQYSNRTELINRLMKITKTCINVEATIHNNPNAVLRTEIESKSKRR